MPSPYISRFPYFKNRSLPFLLGWMLCLVSMAPSAGAVSTNDNRRPAGRLEGDVLNVRLFAGVGSWRPEGPQGAPIEIAAFGEEGTDPSIPGPLIRVREGTTVVLTLRNALGSALRVTGLCARPGNCEPVSVAAGATREIRFSLNAPGTYFYWAATGPGPITARRRGDTQLGGAIVVDPREGSQADRVFVISALEDPPADSSEDEPGDAKSNVFAINGSSWPYTEKLQHAVGDRVRWRIINLSITGRARHAPARLLLHGRSHGRYRRRTAARPGPATHGGHRTHPRWPDVRDVMDTRTPRELVVSLPHDESHECAGRRWPRRPPG